MDVETLYKQDNFITDKTFYTLWGTQAVEFQIGIAA